MFRQIAPDGVVKKEAVDKKLSPSEAMDSSEAAEIEQKPRAVKTSTIALPDRTVESSGPEPTAAKMESSQAEQLVEMTGCPFSGTKQKDDGFIAQPSGIEIIGGNTAVQDSEGKKLSEPSVVGEAQAIAGCPFTSKSKSQE